jgi:hypothetical protein
VLGFSLFRFGRIGSYVAVCPFFVSSPASTRRLAIFRGDTCDIEEAAANAELRGFREGAAPASRYWFCTRRTGLLRASPRGKPSIAGREFFQSGQLGTLGTNQNHPVNDRLSRHSKRRSAVAQSDTCQWTVAVDGGYWVQTATLSAERHSRRFESQCAGACIRRRLLSQGSDL